MTDKNLNVPGAKDDSGKVLAGLLLDFSRALNEVAAVGTFGAQKYTRGGWQEVEDAEQRYTDAFMRHLLKTQTEVIDPETGFSHWACVAWNALAVLELILRKAEEEELRLTREYHKRVEFGLRYANASPISPRKSPEQAQENGSKKGSGGATGSTTLTDFDQLRTSVGAEITKNE